MGKEYVNCDRCGAQFESAAHGLCPRCTKEVVIVPKAEYDRLQERDKFLSCLEAAGVDNWEGYEDACAMRDVREDS
ncbi:hypothetical protein [Anaeroselena agilis]|uniref:Threonine synthase n=1 Tax=Anaeroselena agilis TaxID=3063788 RepID=A0ABU3NXT2_9FIRM|nr:hypothetical protein [Selenomonadales bacterium 4137-cl]